MRYQMKGFQKIKKKSQSMRTRLVTIMILFTVMQSFIFWSALIITDFFGRVDEQSIDTFYLRAQQKVEEVNADTATIVEYVTNASEELTLVYATNTNFLADQHDPDLLGETSYAQQKVNAAQILLNLLDKTEIDGAFYVINDGADGDYTSVLIRTQNGTLSSQNLNTYELVVGNSSIALEYNIKISDDWSINMDSSDVSRNYFNKPLEAVLEYPYGTIEQYGYWDIPNIVEREEDIIYAVPLFNNVGEAYGVIGVELSKDFFITEYVEQDTIGYEESFHALGNISEDGSLEYDPFTPNSELAMLTLSDGLSLTTITSNDHILYETVNEDGVELLCTADVWNLYSYTSPFLEEELMYFTFVPSEYPYSNSQEIIMWFINICSISALIAVIVMVIVSKYEMRNMVRLSKTLATSSPEQIVALEKTNLTEVDDLIDKVWMLNERVVESSKRFETIISMTGLNIGGYEILPNYGGVIVTTYIYNLLGIEPDSKIPQRKWETYFHMLTQEQSPDFDNTYHYIFGDQAIWLRIIHMDTRTGGIGIIHDITADVNATIEYKNQAEYDQLTGLYSRSAFYRRVNDKLLSYPSQRGATLFIDLDNLKYTNDTFGHEAGDDLIRTAASIFDQFSEGEAIVSRLAGDEFAVYLSRGHSEEELIQHVQSVFDKNKDTSILLPNGVRQKIRYSTGISFYPKDATDIIELLKLADFAMYQAKQTEKGSIQIFNEQLYDDNSFITKNRELINHLIEEKKVRFMYQPIVDLHTGEVYAYEMLMRSVLDEFKSPLHILKVAEAESRLGKLEEMLITKAIRDSYLVRDAIGNRKLFLNSITNQILPDDVYEELVSRYGSFLSTFVIEITEGDNLSKKQLEHKLTAIRDANMELAIDDFGSGYSNELRILEIEPDVIKIDMALIQGISKDVNKQELVRNIVAYSHGRGIKIIGEGVEDRNDLEKMIDLGIDYVQGYYVARPSYEILDILDIRKDEIRTYQ
ncbi:MAG: bifunctional diguanylate cyclase/phosphodiesterase [Eubacteriales bacterium]